MSRRRRDLLALGAAAALLFLPGLGARDLWNPDEARYAVVAREMLERGDLFVPHLNGEVYTQKPPLLFWAIGTASLLTGGVDETSARLPSALAAIGAVLFVFLLGERLFGRRAGFLAAAAFATCAKVLWQGRFGQIDMLLVALVTAAVWCWVAMSSRAGARDLGGGRREALPYLFFFFAGLATLAKGPVGLLPPLLSILAYRALAHGRGGLRGLRLGRGLLVWAAVVAAWLLPAALAGGPEYLEQIVFRQNVTRYADPWHHFQPWYYYLTVLPGDFFPWSFLLPAALVVGRREGWLRRREGYPFLFALCWVVVTVLFFSLSSAKRTVYILTMYPALALLVGAALDRAAAAWPRDRRWIAGSLGALAALCVLLAAAVPLVAARRADEVAVLGGEALVWKLTAAVGLLAAGAVAAWLLALRGRPLTGAAALASGTAAMALAAFLFVVPAFDVVKSARPMSRVLDAKLAPGETYGIYPRLDSTFLFYSRRRAVPLEGEEALRRFAARPGRVWLLAQRDDLARLRGGPLPLVEVARDPDASEGYLLLRSR
ncbi:MAG TPA: glycosyltransferase family 39 protein [Thermoanaerobaculia bacterium]|nr:glycosyltransferase family 39 protein [Thermoanaerobaculia bacterium]